MATAEPPGHFDVPPPSVPPPPVAPPRLLPGVDLAVSKRLLWVDGACYPLHNIARVHTLTIHPRRKEAVLRFLKRSAITAAVTVALAIIGSLAASGSDDAGGGLLALVYLGGTAAGVYSFVEMILVLTAQPHFVLAVETSGPSQAVVTSRDARLLTGLVGRIAHAIENPEAEFRVTVDRVTISPRNYYFGDNVNMYGGNGNVGMAGA
jgi:Family of unknown function (DUF6232)